MAQLEQAPQFLSRKREIDAAYRAAIGALRDVGSFPSPDWAESACWLSGLLLAEGRDPAVIVDHFKSLGVEARTFWMPIHLQRPYAAAPRGPVPVCEGLWRRIITLPSSTSLTDDELDVVTQAIGQVLGT